MDLSLHVLLIDDDKEQNAHHERSFLRANYNKIKITLNGGHALVYLHQISDTLRANKLVVLLDMEMPIMDGLDFLKNYNQTPEFCKENILIIVQGDELSENLIEDAKSMGISHFVSKSCKFGVIQNIIKNHFEPEVKNDNGRTLIKKLPYNNQDNPRAAAMG